MRRRNLLVSCGITVLICLSTAVADTGQVNCAADIAGCCCFGTRGNVDCDFNDVTDIYDLAVLIDHLFIDFTPLPSYDEANVDGEDGIDMSDITRLIDHLYISQANLPVCPGIVNHAPETILQSEVYGAQPYINALTPITPDIGVPVSWSGHDRLDHPYEPKPLRYEWRVYGPYDSATATEIRSKFKKRVFTTVGRKVIPVGQGITLVQCDTIWIPDPPHSGIVCDTLLVDTVTYVTELGTIDSLIDVDSSDFRDNPAYNRIALQSGNGGDSTTLDTSVILYDLFRNVPGTSTILRHFILWVRAVDNDQPPASDPTPAFRWLSVIDPKHEHELMMVDAEISYEINGRKLTAAKAFWDSAIERWHPGTMYDYHMISQATGNFLSPIELLSHKLVIVLSDDVIKGVVNTVDIRKRLMMASQGGTQIWMCGRAQIGGDEYKPPKYLPPLELYQIGDWLGVTTYATSGWNWYALQEPSTRVEDFIGADPIYPTWPILTVDSSYLHTRYMWGPPYGLPFVDSLSALPEVTGFFLSNEAEVLYNYNSLYTDHHPILSDSFFFDSKPVVYRIDRNIYRLLISSFTPYSLAGDSSGGAAQVFVDSVLNWLYEPFNAVPNSPPLVHELKIGSKGISAGREVDAVRMKTQGVKP